VPQAQVTIRRAGSTTEQTAVADAAGRVVFERLLPGAYVVSAVRLLSAEERNRLTGPNADVNAFAGGRTADVAAPSAATTVALSARAVDLSRADFEFQGGVDNPQVPNLVSIGPHTPGRGLFWTSIHGVAVLAQPIDVAALPLDRLWNDVQVIRIPADKVVDVLSYWSDHQGPNPLCPRQVHERFNRQGARVLPVGWDNGVGQKRRALLTLPNGRVVLQRTLTNSRDWIAGPPTPGSVP
jgi:hypothetical protein